MTRIVRLAGIAVVTGGLLLSVVAVPAAQAAPVSSAVETRNLKGPAKALWQTAGRTIGALSEGYYVRIEQKVGDTYTAENYGVVRPLGDLADTATWWENENGDLTAAVDGRNNFAAGEARSLASRFGISDAQMDETLERAGLAPGDWVPYDVGSVDEILQQAAAGNQNNPGTIVLDLMMGATKVRATKVPTGVTEYTILQGRKPIAWVSVSNGVVVAVRTRSLFVELLGNGMTAAPDTSGITVVESDFVQQLLQRLTEESTLRSLAKITANNTNARAASGSGVATLAELREEVADAFGDGYLLEWERRGVSVSMDSIPGAPSMPGVCARVVLQKYTGLLKVEAAVTACAS